MVLKRAKFFPQKSPNSWGSVPSVTRLSCNGSFSMGPKYYTIFVQKLFTEPLSLSKTLVALLVAFISAHRYFKRLYGPHTKRTNKRCRAYISLFSKMNT